MRFKPKEKDELISLQNARRKHARLWGRTKFIYAEYWPKKFKQHNAELTRVAQRVGLSDVLLRAFKT